MEKRAIIEPGRTPPENDQEDKTASALESHPTQRAADAAKEQLQRANQAPAKPAK